MPEHSLSKQHHATFESIRQIDQAGNEFWSARDLADHFAGVSKMVVIGSALGMH